MCERTGLHPRHVIPKIPSARVIVSGRLVARLALGSSRLTSDIHVLISMKRLLIAITARTAFTVGDA
jgi:hypothetical protein